MLKIGDKVEVQGIDIIGEIVGWFQNHCAIVLWSEPPFDNLTRQLVNGRAMVVAKGEIKQVGE